MEISDTFRKEVIKSWFGMRESLNRVVLEEFKRQYSSPGQVKGERATFLKLEARERLRKEIRKALVGNDSPHIFIKVFEGIKHQSGDMHDHLVFVTW